MIVYQYSTCSTCRKALKFLSEAGIEFEARDIVSSPPNKATLRKARKLAEVSVNRLFNTSGKSYRDGGFKDKLKSMTEEEAFAALAADGKLIKRPLVVGDGLALVGFREEQWRELLDS